MSTVVAAGNDTAVLNFADALVMPAAVGIAEARCFLGGYFPTVRVRYSVSLSLSVLPSPSPPLLTY